MNGSRRAKRPGAAAARLRGIASFPTPFRKTNAQEQNAVASARGILSSSMQLIDWLLVVIPLAVVFGFAVYTNRYVKSVADFLSAGRCAGRYLLANAKAEAES